MANRAESSAETVIALQAVELKRLLRENKAMSDRVDTLIGEISRLRELHEKEQSQRRQLQEAVVGLMHKVLTPEPVKRPTRQKMKPVLRKPHNGQSAERVIQRTSSLAIAQQRAELSRPEIPAFLRRMAP